MPIDIIVQHKNDEIDKVAEICKNAILQVLEDIKTFNSRTRIETTYSYNRSGNVLTFKYAVFNSNNRKWLRWCIKCTLLYSVQWQADTVCYVEGADLFVPWNQVTKQISGRINYDYFYYNFKDKFKSAFTYWFLLPQYAWHEISIIDLIGKSVEEIVNFLKKL